MTGDTFRVGCTGPGSAPVLTAGPGRWLRAACGLLRVQSFSETAALAAGQHPLAQAVGVAERGQLPKIQQDNGYVLAVDIGLHHQAAWRAGFI